VSNRKLRPLRSVIFASTVVLALTFLAGGAESAPPSPVAGEWHSDVFVDPNLAGNQQRQFYFTFKQMGNRLFGDVLDVYPPEKPTGTPYGLSGKVDGSNIEFEFETQWSSGPKKESFYGEVSGDKIDIVYTHENLRPVQIVAKRVAETGSEKKE
jgi:hypothetical protein